MRNRKLVQIHASTNDSDVAATADLDLGPYINAGQREFEAVWLFFDNGVASDTDHTFDMKIQEAASTVDSDFSDISGAAFTQGTTATQNTLQQIPVTTMKRYIRGYSTLGGTAVSAYQFLGVILTPRFDT